MLLFQYLQHGCAQIDPCDTHIGKACKNFVQLQACATPQIEQTAASFRNQRCHPLIGFAPAGHMVLVFIDSGRKEIVHRFQLDVSHLIQPDFQLR